MIRTVLAWIEWRAWFFLSLACLLLSCGSGAAIIYLIAQSAWRHMLWKQ